MTNLIENNVDPTSSQPTCHSLHSKLRCLESCPVLNRSDNRELYFHMDTIKPLQLEADNSLSRSQLYVPPTIAQNIKDLHSSVRYFSMKFVYFRAYCKIKKKRFREFLSISGVEIRKIFVINPLHKNIQARQSGPSQISFFINNLEIIDNLEIINITYHRT